MNERKYQKCCVILLIILLIAFISFRYNDLKYIIFYQYSFIENIVHYPEMDFYTYCLQQYELFGYEAGACQALWGMPMYLILGIWGIPLFLVSYITKMDIYELLLEMPIVIYGKFILIVFLVLTLILLIKMVRQKCYVESYRNNVVGERELVLLFLSSYFVIAPVFIHGQSDIIELFFLVLGVYFLTVQQDKRLFLAAFVVSVSLKQVSILYFIPLLLLVEKKIIRLMVAIGSVLSFIVLCRMVFGGPFDTSISMANVQVILANKLPFLKGDIPLFVLFYLGICCFCYFYKTEKNMRMVWLSGLIVYGGMNIFSNQIYRCIYVAPFLVMVLSMVRNNVKQILILESALEVCYAFYQICRFYWCFEVTNCGRMFPEKLFGKMQISEKSVLIEKLTMYASSIGLDVIAGSIIVVLSVLIVMAASIKYHNVVSMPMLNKVSQERIILFRIIINGAICLLPVILYGINAVM